MDYFQLGFYHIIPYGYDHILFILCLVLLNSKLKNVVWQATAFTAAHSITLALVMYGYISLPARIIEPLIALSIVFVAVENIISDKLRPTRIILIFFFGLMHGMGFASGLKSLGVSKDQLLTSLITFNLGVEAGQITIILLAWFLICHWWNHKSWYRKGIVIPLSAAIALMAMYWTFQRIV